MISQRMPRITLGANLSFEEFGQALAFTYLSQYSGEAMQPRVFDAYSRAWGTDTIINLAPGVDNNPGATMSLWEGDGLRHCLVAMPGASNFPSLWSMFAGIGYQTVTGCTGSVFHAFASRADTMWTRLHANPRFASVVANNRYQVTFCGHSLGAAMAEILAYRFKAAYPWKGVRCIKFASPRVGTARWNDNADQTVKFASVYFDRDPVHYFPFVPRSMNLITLPAEALILRNFVRDGAPWRLIPNHYSWVNRYPDVGILEDLQRAAQALQGHSVTNPWFDHHLGAYRLAFMNYAGIRPDVLKYRFNYLEHNDENQWQKLFTNGIREYAFMNILDPIQPDPVPPITGDVGLVANAPERLQQVAPIVDDHASDIGGGGDYDMPRAVTVTALPTRRVRPR